MTVYEQDWLEDQTDNLNYLQESVDAGRAWLMSMGSAAAKHNLSIQYCMSHPKHILQSVEINAVTQARASGDYGGSTWKQWNCGVTSAFCEALQLRPSKDTWWSTTTEPGERYGPNAGYPRNETFHR